MRDVRLALDVGVEERAWVKRGGVADLLRERGSAAGLDWRRAVGRFYRWKTQEE